MNWRLLILSLPTQNSTARMRCWRALKATGAAVLRDGVYLLPAGDQREAALGAVAQDVRLNDGVAFCFSTQTPADDLSPLFDRTMAFTEVLTDCVALRGALHSLPAAEALKQCGRLRRTFDQLVAIDFFPGEAQRQTDDALQALELALQQRLSPDEPTHADRAIPTLRMEDFQGRVWATRQRPWVDRLASAWLIRRFIDTQARFVWLKKPANCPKDALGFDFDGATFTHVGARVTFETLLTSFGLETAPLQRLGLLVHSLDAGGVRPPDAAGIERVLARMREALTDDDQLLQAAAGVFEGLLMAYTMENAA